MKRLISKPRENWKKIVESQGLHFHSVDNNQIYWDESACYEFNMIEIDLIERVTNELNEKILEAIQYVIDNKLYNQIGIPEYAIEKIEYSWDNELPSIYGRLDFCYHQETNLLKLYEFNADTPTSLLESSVNQWFWMKDLHPNQDQFNSIHERLIKYWETVKSYLKSGKIHFSATNKSIEDIVTVEYLRDTAIQANLDTEYIAIEDIGYDNKNLKFVDINNEEIKNIFKLYPWEWLLYEEFGKYINLKNQIWIEPTWKMIASNKALLAIMWQLYPNHPNLLRTEFKKFNNNYCIKPFISREGSNVKLIKNGKSIFETDGEYGEEGVIYQELCELPNFDGKYPMIGSWLIDQESAGIGIRETNNLVTNNTACFIPHYIKIV